MLKFSTFSIVARCSRTGMYGVGVSTAVPAVGSLCPYAMAGVGAIATQSWVNPYLGIDGLKLLAEGMGAQIALDRLIEGDPGALDRQVGIVDNRGGSSSWTGASCVPWAGHVTGLNFAAQGNMLVDSGTVQAMVDAFAQTEAVDLPERMLICLEAAQLAGGDKRGKQSAAIKVMYVEEYPYVDLRVDEHRYPVAELRRVFEVARHQLLPFVRGMPSRKNLLGGIPDAVTAMLMTPPPFRPGGGGSG